MKGVAVAAPSGAARQRILPSPVRDRVLITLAHGADFSIDALEHALLGVAQQCRRQAAYGERGGLCVVGKRAVESGYSAEPSVSARLRPARASVTMLDDLASSAARAAPNSRDGVVM